MPRYTCPICKNAVPYEPPAPAVYPFCSERCKLVDLGHWFNERYALEERPEFDPAGPTDEPPDTGT